MDKIKVLSVGECSYINSGYGMYNNGLLRELHKNPNLHIQEFGLFYNPINNKVNTIDWDFYPNILPEHSVMDSDEKFNSWKEWANHTPNHMGGPLFEHILLEAQPDVVIANNDAWHLKYLIDSPYRRFYKLVCLFACDSIPQSWTWIEDMKLCDAVLTYSEWGKREIEKQSPEIKVFGSAPPSCPHVFQPLDKNAVRANFGISPDAKIIGTVMRNQIRKLFPSLFSLFARYLQDTNDKDTYLYVHSKYPDGSWCFPQLIQEYGIAHRVLFTYRCQVKECRHVFSSLYQDIAQCPKCSSFSGVMPGTMDGVSDEELCQIYSMFDLYIQYASCLHKDEVIQSNNTFVKISDVNIGDTVVTHLGNNKTVKDVFKIYKEEDLLEIKVYSDCESLKVTKEHPILAYSQHDFGVSTKRESHRSIMLKLAKKGIQPKFVEADKLKVGDMICYPRQYYTNTIEEIDIVNLVKDKDKVDYIITDTEYWHKNCPFAKYKRVFKIDDDFCKFIGLFAANGSASSDISVTSDNYKQDCYDLCMKVMANFGNVSDYKYIDRDATSVRVSNKLLCCLFQNWVEKKSTKKLPDWVLYLNKHQLSLVFQGWCMGDGYYENGANITVSVTISQNLARQMKIIAKRLGLNYNCRIVYKDCSRQPQYRFEFRGNIAKDGVVTKQTNSRGFVSENYYCHQIKSIKEFEYKDYVYNIEVEDDNSFVTPMCGVHNCEGYGLTQPEAAACGVPVVSVKYSAMEDMEKSIDAKMVNVLTYSRDLNTAQNRAIPDDNHALSIIKEFFSKPSSVRAIFGIRTRKAFEQYYSWSKTADTWTRAIESVYTGKTDWSAPPNIHEPAEKTDKYMSNIEYARWLIKDVGGLNYRLNSFYENQIIRNLNYGCRAEMITNGGGNSALEYNRDIAYNEFKRIAEVNKTKEIYRCQKLGLM